MIEEKDSVIKTFEYHEVYRTFRRIKGEYSHLFEYLLDAEIIGGRIRLTGNQNKTFISLVDIDNIPEWWGLII